MIVVQWVFVETALDYWCAIAFQDCGGDAIEAELPRQFKRKVRFLRKAFRQLPQLDRFQGEALPFIEAAVRISNIRHYVTHGALSGFDHADDETFIFNKMDVGEDKVSHIIGTLRIKGADLLAAGLELMELVKGTSDLTDRIMDAIEPK